MAILRLIDTDVNCRVGSLEIDKQPLAGIDEVNCRVGSLEIEFSQMNYRLIWRFTLRVSARVRRDNGKHDGRA